MTFLRTQFFNTPLNKPLALKLGRGQVAQRRVDDRRRKNSIQFIHVGRNKSLLALNNSVQLFSDGAPTIEVFLCLAGSTAIGAPSNAPPIPLIHLGHPLQILVRLPLQLGPSPAPLGGRTPIHHRPRSRIADLIPAASTMRTARQAPHRLRSSGLPGCQGQHIACTSSSESERNSAPKETQLRYFNPSDMAKHPCENQGRSATSRPHG